MRRYVLFPFLLISFFASVCKGDILGDVNGDGQVGLPEAINALQVTAGMLTSTTTLSPSFNFLDYTHQDNSVYLYRATNYTTSDPPSTSYSYSNSALQTINGEEYMVVSYPDEINFMKVQENAVVLTHIIYNGQEETVTPAIPYGYTDMKIGDIFSSIFMWSDGNMPRYREFTVQGLEDVTTIAGTFEDCLKISRVDSNTSRIIIYYLAKDIGRVKTAFMSQSSSYIEELVSANVGGSQLVGDSFTTCEGTVDMSSATESEILPINVVYASANTNYQGKLVVYDGDWNLHYGVSSQDGTTFSCTTDGSSVPFTCFSIPGNTFTDELGTSYPMTTSNCITH